MKYEITGGYTLIDAEDLPLVEQFTWHIDKLGYARTSFRQNGEQFFVRLHQLILGIPLDRNLVSDHINRVRHDNRRSNLRIANRRLNRINAADMEQLPKFKKELRAAKRNKENYLAV